MSTPPAFGVKPAGKGARLSNGLYYVGDYYFQQVAPPSMSGTRRSGVSTVTVKFGGATPLAKEFLTNIRQNRMPAIEDNGSLGRYNNTTTLTQLFDSFSVDDGKVWTYVDLNFKTPNTDTPTKGREDTSDESLSIQTVKVFGPGKSYYEATYYAPTRTNKWTSAGKAGPRTTGPSGEINIIRERLRIDFGPDPSNPYPGQDLTPTVGTRVIHHESNETIADQLFENQTTVAKVLEDDDRSQGIG